MEEINNGELKIKVSTTGAEMQSIQDVETGHEYQWQGDPRYWDGHSPLLFPNVGGLWNGTYRLQGSIKHLPKHGFMQKKPFDVKEKTDTSLTLTAHDDSETRAMFPFPFVLEETFALNGRTIEVKWKVSTPGREPMPFQIGGHPAFFLDKFQAGDKLKGYLSFDNPTPESAAVGNGGCVGPVRYKLPVDGGMTPLYDETFKNDAIILDHAQVHKITLHNAERKPIVSVNTNSDVTLIWSPYGIEAPFVCIEPWYGLCDHEGYCGEFAARPYTNIAKPGEAWTDGYSIEILN